MIFGKHINHYYLRHLPMLLLGCLSLILVDYFQLVVPRLYQMVINGINDGKVLCDGVMREFNMDFLLTEICRPMIVVIVAMVIGRFLWRICFFGTGIKVETDLRGRMFGHCKDLSQQYYQVNKVGNLMSLFTNDLDTVQECFGMGIMEVCDAAFLGALAIVKMLMMDPVLTLFSMIPMVFLFLIATTVGKYMTKKWDKRQEAFSNLSDFAQESFSGIAVIKAFVKEFSELFAFKKLNRENEDTNVEYAKASTLLHILVTLFVESVICVILGYGGWLVHKGSFNAGQLVEFIGYFTAIVWPVMAISELIDMHARGKASLDRITELLDVGIDVKDREGVTDPGTMSGAIEFRNMTFRYPGSKIDVLHDVSFRIEPGENVGIIGRTGSGKTTIVDLILRTYNVPDGTLFIDGHDVNDISIHSVRANAAYVPQDNFLFSDTIESNIAFASDQKDPALVRHAAESADVAGNIEEFPEKYATVLGERGVTVSGGQKQRISIARALMKNAPILILDDSVSAVDVKTEETILKNLRTERAGKTTILIAHRITTVKNLDKIILVTDGRITAVGSHDQLVETCPEYASMVELQRLDDEINGTHRRGVNRK